MSEEREFSKKEFYIKGVTYTLLASYAFLPYFEKFYQKLPTSWKSHCLTNQQPQELLIYFNQVKCCLLKLLTSAFRIEDSIEQVLKIVVGVLNELSLYKLASQISNLKNIKTISKCSCGFAEAVSKSPYFHKALIAELLKDLNLRDIQDAAFLLSLHEALELQNMCCTCFQHLFAQAKPDMSSAIEQVLLWRIRTFDQDRASEFVSNLKTCIPKMFLTLNSGYK
ncbi:hypothetical protein Ciccas_001848 [Cichlidogyrus casuarinus]|uniref:Uncharacterized protein n=1 Tax=Cichlidogyrus casuarinus TaxID=1844966 RepID=A0ABD2QJG0_9PLAT